mmetsp:Transcript_18639/g.43217  ORF Transcript_18639/g.43217 Transcript_18639/m.43217 type:complete len:103 (-) Transcript_18639:11-319(-)
MFAILRLPSSLDWNTMILSRQSIIAGCGCLSSLVLSLDRKRSESGFSHGPLDSLSWDWILVGDASTRRREEPNLEPPSYHHDRVAAVASRNTSVGKDDRQPT